MGRSPAYVRGMFTAIAPRYDFLNHLLSLNVDRPGVAPPLRGSTGKRKPDGTYLDLCAGTLDPAAEPGAPRRLSRRVIGADFAVPMLTTRPQQAPRTVPVAANALELPFPAARFDGALVGFCVQQPRRPRRRVAARRPGS